MLIKSRCKRTKILRDAVHNLIGQIQDAGLTLEHIICNLPCLGWGLWVKTSGTPGTDTVRFKIVGGERACEIKVITCRSGRKHFRTLPHGTFIENVVGELTSLLASESA